MRGWHREQREEAGTSLGITPTVFGEEVEGPKKGGRKQKKNKQHCGSLGDLSACQELLQKRVLSGMGGHLQVLFKHHFIRGDTEDMVMSSG